MHTAAIGTRVKICCILMTEKQKWGQFLRLVCVTCLGVFQGE